MVGFPIQSYTNPALSNNRFCFGFESHTFSRPVYLSLLPAAASQGDTQTAPLWICAAFSWGWHKQMNRGLSQRILVLCAGFLTLKQGWKKQQQNKENVTLAIEILYWHKQSYYSWTGADIIIIKVGMSWLWIAGTLGDHISLSLSLSKIEFPPSHQMATLLFMDYIDVLQGGKVTDKVFLKKTRCILFQLHRWLQLITYVSQQPSVYPIRKITKYFRGLRIIWSAKRFGIWKKNKKANMVCAIYHDNHEWQNILLKLVVQM